MSVPMPEERTAVRLTTRAERRERDRIKREAERLRKRVWTERRAEARERDRREEAAVTSRTKLTPEDIAARKRGLIRAAKAIARECDGVVSPMAAAWAAGLTQSVASPLIAELRKEHRWPWHGRQKPRTDEEIKEAMPGEMLTIKTERLDEGREEPGREKLPPTFARPADAIRHEFRGICQRRGWLEVMPRFVNWRAP